MHITVACAARGSEARDVVDFTDPANPIEIADEEELVVGGYWSSYWYDGHVCATEIVRGLDVFALEPSEFLTEREIAAAALADQVLCFSYALGHAHLIHRTALGVCGGGRSSANEADSRSGSVRQRQHRALVRLITHPNE